MFDNNNLLSIIHNNLKYCMVLCYSNFLSPMWLLCDHVFKCNKILNEYKVNVCSLYLYNK